MKKFNLDTIIPLLEESFFYPKPSYNSPLNRLSGAAGCGFGLILFSLIISLKYKNILETGTASGGSAYPLLLGAYLNDGKLTSIDNGNFPVHRDWVKNIPLEGIEQHDNLIITDSINFLKETNEIYDFIFIDDWHEYNHVLTQLEIIRERNLISSSGIITMHDTMYGNFEPKYREELNSTGEFGNGGVYKAIKDFIKKYPDEWEYSTLPVDHGFTILRKIII